MTNRLIQDKRERLYIHSDYEGALGRYELPSGLMPASHTGPRPRLQTFRALGQTKIIVVGDKLPPAESARATWSGLVEFETEHHLSKEHARWDWLLANASAVDRDAREVFPISFASLESAPEGQDSNRAVWSVEFIFSDVLDRRTAQRLWGW